MDVRGTGGLRIAAASLCAVGEVQVGGDVITPAKSACFSWAKRMTCARVGSRAA